MWMVATYVTFKNFPNFSWLNKNKMSDIVNSLSFMPSSLIRLISKFFCFIRKALCWDHHGEPKCFLAWLFLKMRFKIKALYCHCQAGVGGGGGGKGETLKNLCPSQTKASTSPPPQTFEFLENFLFKFPPSQGRKAVQMPHHRSIPGDQMPPPRETFR